MGPYQVLPLRIIVDLGAFAMKEYSTFFKDPALLEPRHQIINVIIGHSLVGRVLPLCRDTVVVFYSPRQLGCFDVLIL